MHCKTRGVLAHLVERNTGSVEVSGSSPLYSTPQDGVSYEVSNEFKLVIWSEPPLGSAISFYAGKDQYVFGFVAWTGDWDKGKYCEPKVGMDISKLGVDGDDYLPEMKLNLTDDDEIECEYVSGSLIITALSKKTITLKFSNLKMSDGKGTTHTFNGTIKFSLS